MRLKGGCPAVFSRVSSEAAALTAVGCSWELVPGVSSALAAPLLAGEQRCALAGEQVCALAGEQRCAECCIAAAFCNQTASIQQAKKVAANLLGPMAHAAQPMLASTANCICWVCASTFVCLLGIAIYIC